MYIFWMGQNRAPNGIPENVYMSLFLPKVTGASDIDRGVIADIEKKTSTHC